MIIISSRLKETEHYRPGEQASGIPHGHLIVTAETPREIEALKVLADCLYDQDLPSAFDIDEYPDRPTLDIFLVECH